MFPPWGWNCLGLVDLLFLTSFAPGDLERPFAPVYFFSCLGGVEGLRDALLPVASLLCWCSHLLARLFLVEILRVFLTRSAFLESPAP